MTVPAIYNALLVGVFIAAPISALALLFSTAPYGRHDKGRAGPSVETRLGWVLMECPSVFAFGYFFVVGPSSREAVPLIFAFMWGAHYIQRTFDYPRQMRVGKAATVPIAIVAMGATFNFVNSYLNASWIGTYGVYKGTWIADPRFIVGVLVFCAGYVINRQSDTILRELRKPGETGYKIPRGGLYRLVSCPNYFGELLIWTGWTLATWSLAGLSFAVFTAANLVPRAVANHRWYTETFEDYPPERKAVIPHLL